MGRKKKTKPLSRLPLKPGSVNSGATQWLAVLPYIKRRSLSSVIPYPPNKRVERSHDCAIQHIIKPNSKNSILNRTESYLWGYDGERRCLGVWLSNLTKIAHFDFYGLRLRVNYEHTCWNYMFMISDRWSWSAECLYFLYSRDLHLCTIKFLGTWLESTYRLLLQSQFESALWEVAFCWSVSWAIPDSIRNHNYAWEGFCLTVEKNNGAVIPHVTFWTIWGETQKSLRVGRCKYLHPPKTKKKASHEFFVGVTFQLPAALLEHPLLSAPEPRPRGGAMTQAPTASKIFQSATCISSLCVLHQPYSSIIPITMACQTGSIPYVLCQFS